MLGKSLFQNAAAKQLKALAGTPYAALSSAGSAKMNRL
jgi:hypothetical protein